MEDFNASVKNVNNNEVIFSNKIFVAKSPNLEANVNGAIKSLSIKNLPTNYTAYTGVYGKELHNVEGKKVYAKFYIKILDPFGREVSDFRSNHHLQGGLDIEFTSTNTLNDKVKVIDHGVYAPVDGKYSLKLFNNAPIEVKEVSQETKATNHTSSVDPSTWWIIGGIFAGVIIFLVIIWWFYGSKENFMVDESMVFVSNPKSMSMQKINTRMLY
jgi:hypothetical protein